VVFDVGETLFDETRVWMDWADWLGVPRFTFSAILGSVIERGEPHERAFEIVRPGIDIKREYEALIHAHPDHFFSRADLYPDALPCLQALRAAGYRLGLSGNQGAQMEASIADLALPADLVACSASLGVEKPSPTFFAALARAVEFPAGEIAYVGDRVDNDVIPAAAAGMVAVFLRRGPWGYIQGRRPQVGRAAIQVDSLDDLPAALKQYAGGPPAPPSA